MRKRGREAQERPAPIAFAAGAELRETSIPKELLRGLNPKKAHEVAMLASLVDWTAQRVGSRKIIDFGSGKGYLGKVLAVIFHYEVQGIERNPSLCQKAEDTIRQLLRKHQDTGKTQGSFSSVLLDVQASLNSADLDVELEGAVLVGLHACGDLSPKLLRSFVEGGASALVSVGCCYHKMTEGCQELGTCGFPMSRENTQVRLGTRAREAAEHQAGKWTAKSSEALRTHAWRAILEVALSRNGSDSQEESDDREPAWEEEEDHECAEFLRYAKAQKSYGKLGGTNRNHLLLQAFREHRHRGVEVAGVYALSLLLAQTTEAFLLWDRCVYLTENERQTCIIQLFDPVISPRNCAIVSLQ